MSENPILMTQAEYARHCNKSPQYIGKLYALNLSRSDTLSLLSPARGKPPTRTCGRGRTTPASPRGESHRLSTSAIASGSPRTWQPRSA